VVDVRNDGDVAYSCVLLVGLHSGVIL
jgi:hypothetical protein